MLFLASWAILMGPVQYGQHLLSGPRLPFTAAYFGSIVLTLVFAIKVGLPHPARSRHMPWNEEGLAPIMSTCTPLF